MRQEEPVQARFVLTQEGRAFQWEKKSITLHPLGPQGQSSIDGELLRQVLIKAAASWNYALRSCQVPRLQVGPVERLLRPAVQDRASVVFLKTDSSCSDEKGGPSSCFKQGSQATTHLYTVDGQLRAGDGRLDEADIEIDAVNTDWSSVTAQEDLLALLVHELGHVLGLEHPCRGEDLCSAQGALASVMHPAPLLPGRERLVQPDAESVSALCNLYGVSAEGSRGVRTEISLALCIVLSLFVLFLFLFFRKNVFGITPH